MRFGRGRAMASRAVSREARAPLQPLKVWLWGVLAAFDHVASVYVAEGERR